MLNVIEPKDHHLYRPQIDALLSFLKIYQDFSPSSEITENAMFIVAEDEKLGVYGGAIVYPQNVRALYQKLANALLEFLPEKEQVWSTCICFCADQDDGFLTLETLEVCENFYRDLHKALSEVGKKKGTNYLALTLHSKDHRNTITYGRWSYLLEVNPSDSSDYRFHGLLALKNKTNEVFEVQEEEFDFDDQDDADRYV